MVVHHRVRVQLDARKRRRRANEGQEDALFGVVHEEPPPADAADHVVKPLAIRFDSRASHAPTLRVLPPRRKPFLRGQTP